MKKNLEEELEELAYLAETYPNKVLDETEEMDVTPRLEREWASFYLAPHIVEALRQRARKEGKSITNLLEQWLTEKLFIESKDKATL